MRIIKPPDNEDPQMIEKELAIKGCDICPACKAKNDCIFSINLEKTK